MKSLRMLAKEIEERVRKAWNASQAKPTTADQRTPPAAKLSGKRLYTLSIWNDTLNLLGLVRDEEVEVHEADDLKPGDPAALEVRGRETVLAGRVVTADAEQITVRYDGGVRSVSRADLISSGRIDHLNPKKADPLNEADRERVDELREAIERLGREDDQIIRCTERYRLEKEIYDIEHPVAGDPDDWSAWKE